MLLVNITHEMTLTQRSFCCHDTVTQLIAICCSWGFSIEPLATRPAATPAAD